MNWWQIMLVLVAVACLVVILYAKYRGKKGQPYWDERSKRVWDYMQEKEWPEGWDLYCFAMKLPKETRRSERALTTAFMEHYKISRGVASARAARLRFTLVEKLKMPGIF